MRMRVIKKNLQRPLHFVFSVIIWAPNTASKAFLSTFAFVVRNFPSAIIESGATAAKLCSQKSNKISLRRKTHKSHKSFPSHTNYYDYESSSRVTRNKSHLQPPPRANPSCFWRRPHQGWWSLRAAAWSRWKRVRRFRPQAAAGAAGCRRPPAARPRRRALRSACRLESNWTAAPSSSAHIYIMYLTRILIPTKKERERKREPHYTQHAKGIFPFLFGVLQSWELGDLCLAAVL